MRTAVPCRSSTASSRARTSASPCPSAQSAIARPMSRRRNRLMRRRFAGKKVLGGISAHVLMDVVLASLVAALAAMLGGCADLLPRRDATPPVQAPVIDRQAASATLISGYLENLQRLVQSAPAQQAEMAATAQREYDLAPT